MKVVEGTAEIEDLDSFVATIGDIGDEYDCAIQAFDADLVVGSEHLETAVEHADRAFDREENIARERAVEILLYAAGRRQINRALQMGVSEGDNRLAVVVHGVGEGEVERSEDEREHGDGREHGDDREQAATEVRELLTPTATLEIDHSDRGAVREFFDIGDAELAATDATLADLVCERVALLEVEK